MDDSNWIQTYTKKKVYPLNFKLEDVDIFDIAHSLSNECRYSGHCKTFYSVAQHSVLMADFMEKEGNNPEEIFQALLHDASEYVLRDIPRPLKHASEFAFYRILEDKVQAMIYEKFGLPEIMLQSVKLWDDILLDR